MTGEDTPDDTRSARRERPLSERALRHLARREHSRAELRRRLAPYARSPSDVEAVLDRLVQQGFLSDERFAAALARSRGQRHGSARIRLELKSHGIGDELIRSTVESLASSERERARALWERRFGQVARKATERARQIRFLRGRGFAEDVIRDIVAGRDDD